MSVAGVELVIAEKRREIRRPAHGAVTVHWITPRDMQVAGRLVDVSASGFRMAHDCASLVSGQVVEFAHDQARGAARCVWTRILTGSIESGFVIVA